MQKKPLLLTITLLILLGTIYTSSNNDVKYIGDLTPISVVTHDGELYVDKTYLDLPIIVGGVEYERGISMHPAEDGTASVVYNIEGLGYKTFFAVGGKDKTAGSAVGGDSGINGTKVSMEVWVDDVLVEVSGVLPYPETHTFSVNIENAKKLKLVVTDGGDGIYCDATSWANACLSNEDKVVVPTKGPTPTPTQKPVITPDPSLKDKDTVYLSDIVWTESYSYKNGQVGDFATKDANNAEEELWIAGEFFEKGICMHAIPSAEAFVEFNIEGLGFTTFASYIGIAESMLYDLSMATVSFKVYVDGVEKYSKDLMVPEDPAEKICVDITDAKVLRIAIGDGGKDGISGDWGAFCNAKLTKLTDENTWFATPEKITTPTKEPTPTKTVDPTPTPAGTTSDNSKNDNSTFIVIAIASVCVIAIVFVLLLVKSKKKGANHG
jgi:hypothetical protein